MILHVICLHRHPMREIHHLNSVISSHRSLLCSESFLQLSLNLEAIFSFPLTLGSAGILEVCYCTMSPGSLFGACFLPRTIQELVHMNLLSPFMEICWFLRGAMGDMVRLPIPGKWQSVLLLPPLTLLSLSSTTLHSLAQKIVCYLI